MRRVWKNKRLAAAIAAAVLAVLLLACVNLIPKKGTVQNLPGNLYEFGLILEEKENGLYVMGVAEDSPAELMGISPGDMILELNGNAVESSDQFESSAVGIVGGALRITVERDGERLTLELEQRQ